MLLEGIIDIQELVFVGNHFVVLVTILLCW